MRSFRLLSVLAIAAATLVPAGARAATPATFKVGFGRSIIDPTRPQFLGGFGYGDPVQTLASPDDHMEVRAIAIADAAGANLVEMAIVDTQGYFAGNQEGPWASRDARLAAAQAITDAHVVTNMVTDANIIVSSTHSHAAPTIMGIWGYTDPDYLKQVYQGTVDALVNAAKSLQPANLYAAEADISPAIVAQVTQTDGYQGWPPDGRTPILWARDPSTGATRGMYVNVPVHADIVDGVDSHIISADHIGFERRALDAALGGESVVAMGTLGRQESIIQVRGLTHAQALGSFVTNQVERALGYARPISDGSVAAAQQYLSLPATNPALLGLNAGNRAADALSNNGVTDANTSHCAASDVACTIDRETLPPYAVGDNLGTWVTALRVGDLMYASEPGEAFPEVSDGIRNSVPGVDVRIIGMAQDQLGYYYPAETYPWTFFNNSDHQIYNSSLLLGDGNVQAQALNAQALGFQTQLVHQTSQFDDTVAAQHAGTQFFPLKVESSSRTLTVDARWSGSAFGSAFQGQYWTDSFGGPITWEWGDGTTETSGQFFVSHTFPHTGSFTVRAAVTDPRDGYPEHLDVKVTIDDRLEVHVHSHDGSFVIDHDGGTPGLLAAHWHFDDGTTADSDGYHPVADNGQHGSVTVIDSAGNTDTANF